MDGRHESLVYDSLSSPTSTTNWVNRRGVRKPILRQVSPTYGLLSSFACNRSESLQRGRPSNHEEIEEINDMARLVASAGHPPQKAAAKACMEYAVREWNCTLLTTAQA